MKVSKSDFEISANLCKVLEVALKRDDGKENEVDEEEIWKLYQQQEKERVLEHCNAAAQLRYRSDVVRSRIRNRHLERIAAVETANKQYDDFHRPFKNQIIEELRVVYGKCEKSKAYSLKTSTGVSNFLLPTHKIRTNILEALRALKDISRETAWVSTCCVPLGEMVTRIEKFLKDFSMEFTSKDITLFGDGELGNFRTLFSAKDHDKVDWEPLVLSEDVLRRQIGIVFDAFEPKRVTLS